MTTLISTPVAPAGTSPQSSAAPQAKAPALPATPVAPAAAPQTPEAQAIAALTLEKERYRKDLDKKTRESIAERRKWDGEKKGLSEKLKDAEFGARIKREGQVNRVAIAKEIWGDKWYEALTESQLSGGAPTAESVQLEFDKRDAAWKAELARRDEEAKTKEQASRASQSQQELQRFHGTVAAGLKAGGERLPALLERYGNEAEAAAAVVARIRKHFDTTSAAGAGEVLPWGKVALDMEAEERALVERIKGRLTPAPVSGGNAQPKAQQQSGSVLQQVSRKTLSNDLTASTQGSRPAPRNDEERAQRMREAYEAAVASRQNS